MSWTVKSERSFYCGGHVYCNYWSNFVEWSHRFSNFEEAERCGKQGIDAGHVTSYIIINNELCAELHKIKLGHNKLRKETPKL